MNHFAVLGLSKDASKQDIKKAFLKLAKEWHPDVNKSPEAAERFRLISASYEFLQDDARRAQWLSDTTAHYEVRGASGTSKYRGDAYEQWLRRKRYANSRAKHTRTLSMASFAERFTQPKFLFGALPVAAIIFWFISSRSNLKHTSPVETVEAWYNPRTSRYEAPAPWDPLYRQNLHSLKQVDRRLVSPARPP